MRVVNETEAHPALESRPGGSTRALWLPVVALLVCGVLAWFLLPVSAWTLALERWFRELGTLGILVFVAAYVVGTVVLAPGSAMSILGGIVFGWWGVLLVLIAASLGTSLAFLVARYGARDTVARWLENRPTLKAIDKAVDEEGWKVVLLLRLSPLVPFGLQNYLFGLTSVGFWPYAAATLGGIVPGTLLYVSLGALGRGAASGNVGGLAGWSLLGVGVLATVAAAVLVGRKVREKLRTST
jgi:uncharacterized membrane protein YdjX (TVP38/TMEM64 family)